MFEKLIRHNDLVDDIITNSLTNSIYSIKYQKQN